MDSPITVDNYGCKTFFDSENIKCADFDRTGSTNSEDTIINILAEWTFDTNTTM
jgi:hypothetical protein